MTTGTSLSYSLLGHVVTVHGDETGPTLPHRLDALLGPGVSGNGRRTSHCTRTMLTLRHENAIWHLVDKSDDFPCAPMRTEDEVAQVVEWLAYSAAVRHSDLPLILHSGAVARNGVAVLLPNASGAGKTTLTLALAARGWLPLTDDICPLVARGGELMATGCRRCCHLSSPSLAVLQSYGIALEGPLGGLSLYYRPKVWGEPAPVRGIVIPQLYPREPNPICRDHPGRVPGSTDAYDVRTRCRFRA